MLSVLAVFAVGAIASASASAASLEWEVCEELAGVGKEPPLKFDTHKCNSEEKLLAERKWEWKLLAAGQTQKVVSEGGTFTLTGGPVTITCTKLEDQSDITGGKPGTDLALKILFLGCTTSNSKCKVKSAGPPAKAGEIEVVNVPTEIITTRTAGGVVVEADLFKGTKGIEEEFVTLEIGEKETASGNKMEKKCASAVPLTTKVTGGVAGEAMGSGELNFPARPLEASKLEAFGVSVTLEGLDTQAVVQSFTETVAQGWAIRMT